MRRVVCAKEMSWPQIEKSKRRKGELRRRRELERDRESSNENNNIVDDDFAPFDAKTHKANYINHKLKWLLLFSV